MTQQPPKKSGLRSPMLTRTAAAARRNQSTQNNRHNNHSSNGHNHNQNRSMNKNRVNPREAFEKYMALAKEVLAQDDKILAENYYQHADHYYRLILEMRARDHQRSSEAERENTAPTSAEAPTIQPQTSCVKMPRANVQEEKVSAAPSVVPTFEKVDRIEATPLFLQQSVVLEPQGADTACAAEVRMEESK